MKLEPRGTFKSGEHEPRIAIVGDRLVLVSGGGVEIWDRATLTRLQRIRGLVPGHVEDDEETFPGESEPHGDGHLRVTPDGRTAITWGGLRNVQAWRLEEGTRGARFFHGATASDAVLTPDGKAVISTCRARKISELVVWDPITGEERARLTHPPLIGEDVLSACPACLDARREWDDPTEACPEHGPLVKHDCSGELALHADGRLLVSGGDGICAWDLERGWLGLMSPASSTRIAIAEDGRVYATTDGLAGRSLGIWTAVGGAKVAEVPLGPSIPIRAIVPGPSSVILHTQTHAELLELDGTPRSSFEPKSGAWLCLPDGEHIVVEGHFPSRLLGMRLSDGATVLTLDRPDFHLRAVDRDGLVAITEGYTVHLFTAMR